MTECEHGSVAMENPRIVEDSYEEYVIVEYDEICCNCGETISTAKHKYYWESAVFDR